MYILIGVGCLILFVILYVIQHFCRRRTETLNLELIDEQSVSNHSINNNNNYTNNSTTILQPKPENHVEIGDTRPKGIVLLIMQT